MVKKNKLVDATEFSSYAEGWIERSLSRADILSTPGVIELILEEYNNDILAELKWDPIP